MSSFVCAAWSCLPCDRRLNGRLMPGRRLRWDISYGGDWVVVGKIVVLTLRCRCISEHNTSGQRRGWRKFGGAPAVRESTNSQPIQRPNRNVLTVISSEYPEHPDQDLEKTMGEKWQNSEERRTIYHDSSPVGHSTHAALRLPEEIFIEWLTEVTVLKECEQLFCRHFVITDPNDDCFISHENV